METEIHSLSIFEAMAAADFKKALRLAWPKRSSPDIREIIKICIENLRSIQ